MLRATVRTSEIKCLDDNSKFKQANQVSGFTDLKKKTLKISTTLFLSHTLGFLPNL